MVIVAAHAMKWVVKQNYCFPVIAFGATRKKCAMFLPEKPAEKTKKYRRRCDDNLLALRFGLHHRANEA